MRFSMRRVPFTRQALSTRRLTVQRVLPALQVLVVWRVLSGDRC
jgi:hypothetical protein